MVEHVARTLCRAACRGNRETTMCPVCDRETPLGWAAGECSMWETFRGEAHAAIEAVRDYAMLTTRRKPRLRTPIAICALSSEPAEKIETERVE